MSSKKANCRVFATLEEARDAYRSFCRWHHKAEPHECLSAYTRRPLHRIMAFLPTFSLSRRRSMHLLVLSNQDASSGESDTGSEAEEEEQDEGPLFDDDDVNNNALVYYPSPTNSPLPPSSPPLAGFEVPPSSPTTAVAPSSSTVVAPSSPTASETVGEQGRSTPEPTHQDPRHGTGLQSPIERIPSGISETPLEPLFTRPLESVSSSGSITSAVLAGEGPSDMELFETCNASGPFFLVRLQSSRSYIFQSRYNAESIMAQFRKKNLSGCMMKCPGLANCPDKLVRGNFETLYYGVRGRTRYGVFTDM
ncbi:hypothetical protein BDN71DRAFT_423784 [Pleurotus eryngii]|uniref:Uncharacterized protein n=1 Tax=Pleurotus eryngii TaxID=5323 RepID=A0A9P6A741_PLEER|nr:hypothetical protein BDN71DRAFT_423784 [Pleurotus eryngii]